VAPILDILKQATGGKLETIGKKRREVEESLRDIVAGIDMGKKSGGALRQLTGKKGEFTELWYGDIEETWRAVIERGKREERGTGKKMVIEKLKGVGE